jgi:FkbM family methyltransferase
MHPLKQLASRLPHRWQNELKRIRFARQINRSSFVTDEPEFKILDKLIHAGDWVVDIGANVGHYTKRFSELVGANGRVIAFEPVPATFSLLAANVQLFASPNVSLVNAAVSDRLDIVGMDIPKFGTGLDNYYQAHLSSGEDNAFSVLTVSLDSLGIKQRVALVKIDVEGHEASVLAGMRNLIEMSHPFLIVETSSKQVIGDLVALGYAPERLRDSPNVLFSPKKDD